MATKPKKAADLARKIWRTQGVCEHCGKTKYQVQLQGAHIIGVGTAIRVCSDIRNGFSLCSYCHRWFSDHPFEFIEWVDTTWAKEYIPTLRELARPGQGQKIDWDERIVFLQGILKQLENKQITIQEARTLEADYRP